MTVADKLRAALRKRELAKRAWIVAQRAWLEANAEIERPPAEDGER